MRLLALIIVTYYDACDIVENTCHLTCDEEVIADAIAMALVEYRASK